MRKSLFVLLLAILSGVSYAQNKTEALFQFKVGEDIFLANYQGNNADLKKLSDFIAANKDAITSGKAPIYVDSYSASRGLGKIMANRVKSELIVRDGMKESYFKTQNLNGNYNGETNLVTVKITITDDKPMIAFQDTKADDAARAKCESDLAKAKADADKAKSDAQRAREDAERARADAERARAEAAAALAAASSKKNEYNYLDKFSLRTNLLYWAWATPNLGMEWRPTKGLGLLLNAGATSITVSKYNRHMKGWFVAPEVRAYLGEQKRWFIGAQFLGGNFDVLPGSITTFKGSLISGGLTGGYKMPISKNFMMDFSLGLGVGSWKYDISQEQPNGSVRNVNGLSKTTFMPVQAGVSLIWVINKHE